MCFRTVIIISSKCCTTIPCNPKLPSLLSVSSPKSEQTWRLFLQRNTYAHGLVLHQPTMKVQGRKNLSESPRPDAISNRFLCSAPALRSRANSILKFVTATYVLKSVAVIRKQSLPLQGCFLYHMLKNGENYNSDLYKKSDVLPTTHEITVEQAILMAQFQGYRIKSATE